MSFEGHLSFQNHHKCMYILSVCATPLVQIVMISDPWISSKLVLYKAQHCACKWVMILRVRSQCHSKTVPSHSVLMPFRILYFIKQTCDVGRNMILLTSLCGNYQTSQHVLNNCETSLKSGGYTWCRNSVLICIYIFLEEHLPRSRAISVDLSSLPCILPSVISNSSPP